MADRAFQRALLARKAQRGVKEFVVDPGPDVVKSATTRAIAQHVRLVSGPIRKAVATVKAWLEDNQRAIADSAYACDI
jgi:hypothetical protein